MDETSVMVRVLSAEDSEDLWRIRNDPSVRKHAHDDSPIPRNQHEAWFHRYLANPDNAAFVIEFEGRLAGYCRVDNGLVSIALDPAFHGRGLGKRLLTESVRRSAGRWPSLTAEVRLGNTVSQRLFEAVGFSLVQRTEDRYEYRYDFSRGQPA